MDETYGDRKRALFTALPDSLVEIGPGAGANFRYYAPATEIIAVEPNPFMAQYLVREAEKYSLKLRLEHASAESIPLPNDSVEAVVCTLVLCSVESQEKVLREVFRILKPGGRFLFLEHVAAQPATWNRRMQNAVRPAWQFLADGCVTNRETWRVLEGIPFTSCEIEHFRAEIPLPLIKPHIAGWAMK